MDNTVNGFYSQIVGGLSSGATTLTVLTGDGATAPQTAPYNLSIRDARWSSWAEANKNGEAEIIRVTVIPSGDTFPTIVRAQEGTTAKNFNVLNHTYIIEQNVTRALLLSANYGDPSSRYLIEEDFDGGTNTSAQIGRNGWGLSGSGSGSGGYVQPRTSGAIGEFFILTGAISASKTEYLYLPTYSDASSDGLFTGSQPFDLKMRVALVNTGAPATGHKVYMWGLAEAYDVTANNLPKGIFFYAQDAGTIQASCVGAGTSQTDTSVAQSSSYVSFEIISDGTNVNFYVSGVLKATISTNLPTTGLKFFFYAQSGTDSVAKQMNIDYLFCTATLAR